MTVYKCHMKILKRNLGLVIMYLAIFFSITMFIQAASRKEGLDNYQQTRISIAICDRDHSALSDGLIQYLSNIHQVSMIQDDLSVMQEELFYRNVEYIIQIPENFYDSCIFQGTPLSVTRIPGSYSSYYVDQQINSYRNTGIYLLFQIYSLSVSWKSLLFYGIYSHGFPQRRHPETYGCFFSFSQKTEPGRISCYVYCRDWTLADLYGRCSSPFQKRLLFPAFYKLLPS